MNINMILGDYGKLNNNFRKEGEVYRIHSTVWKDDNPDCQKNGWQVAVRNFRSKNNKSI
jgi:hypothetical protein